MKAWQRRSLYTIIGVSVLIFCSSILYHILINTVEGRSVDYFESLQVVIETYTGTGYGAHSTWDSTILNLFISVMDLSTFLLVFIILPYVFQPVLSAALSPDAPTKTDQSEHIVVCGYSPRVERLVEEFRSLGADYVVVVEDQQKAADLVRADHSVIHGSPTSVESLQNAGLDRASSVILDMDDVDSVSAVLACRSISDDIQIVALIQDRSFEQYLHYAGADRVLTPRRLLGERIAHRVKAELNPQQSDLTLIGDSYALAEITVSDESPLCHSQVSEADNLYSGELRIIGIWNGGEFEVSPAPVTEIAPHHTLFIAGPKDDLERLVEESSRSLDTETAICLAGYGEVGATVVQSLESSGFSTRIIDAESGPEIDVVGDVTDEETLISAGIEDAAALVLTISDDKYAILATIVARERNPDLDIIARVNDSEQEAKIRRAGADYVLSLPDISGRMLAQEVLREEILAYDRQLKIIEIDGAEYANKRLDQTAIPESDCYLIGVKSNGEIITEVDHSHTFKERESLILVGTERAVQELEAGFEP